MVREADHGLLGHQRCGGPGLFLPTNAVAPAKISTARPTTRAASQAGQTVPRPRTRPRGGSPGPRGRGLHRLPPGRSRGRCACPWWPSRRWRAAPLRAAAARPAARRRGELADRGALVACCSWSGLAGASIGGHFLCMGGVTFCYPHSAIGNGTARCGPRPGDPTVPSVTPLGQTAWMRYRTPTSPSVARSMQALPRTERGPVPRVHREVVLAMRAYGVIIIVDGDLEESDVSRLVDFAEPRRSRTPAARSLRSTSGASAVAYEINNKTDGYWWSSRYSPRAAPSTRWSATCASRTTSSATSSSDCPTTKRPPRPLR